jgi:PilZ domain
MPEDILNPRRAPRAAIRCDVELRHRLTVWNGETEDVAPGGCRVVTSRLVDPGRTVKLAIRSDALPRSLLVFARVVWARAHPPARLGLSFESGAGAAAEWFQALVQARPAVLGAARNLPLRLAAATPVHLGAPPPVLVDFTVQELDLLRRVGRGATLDALVRSSAPDRCERARGAFFALLARGHLVVDPAASSGPEAWIRVLSRRGSEVPAVRLAPAAGALTPRTPEAQRLYDEGLAHIGNGRLGAAMDRLREAQKHAPQDATISATMKRLSRWEE